MDVAFIAPISLVDTQDDQQYQLMLPQLFSLSYKYAQAYYDYRRMQKFIILDNGAAEKNQVGMEELLQVAHEVAANEIAVPDTLYDARDTLLKLDTFFSSNLDMIDRLRLGYGTQFGFVAQGHNIEEAFALTLAVMRCRWNAYIDTVYLPRLLITSRNQRHERIKLADMIHKELGDRLNIHLFGSAPTYVQEVRVAAIDAPYIRSMDTSLPYNLTFNRASIIQSPSIWDQDRGLPGKRPSDYFDLKEENFDKELLEFNMNMVRRWAHG